MSTKESYPSAETICKRVKELNDERREFFLRWIESHTGLKKLHQEGRMQKVLNTWLSSLPGEQAATEYALVIAEINWCAKISLPTLRRIASAERQDNRRSLYEQND